MPNIFPDMAHGYPIKATKTKRGCTMTFQFLWH